MLKLTIIQQKNTISLVSEKMSILSLSLIEDQNTKISSIQRPPACGDKQYRNNDFIPFQFAYIFAKNI